MYIPVIIIGIIGLLFLLINVICFVKDYSLVVNNKLKKKLITANVIGIFGSICLIILSLLYFVLVTIQL